MHIGGKTKISGLFGYPVSHTMSPLMHNAAFRHLDIDCCYLPFPVHPDYLGQAVEAIRALSIIGVNLTIPHKEAALPFLDTIDEKAAAIGAINTIVNNNGSLAGYNTDGQGFMKSLHENGIDPSEKQVLLIGAGGSSRAICYYLGREAKTLSLYNRTRNKADSLAGALSSDRGSIAVIDNLSDLDAFDIIINATALGLKAEDPMPFDTGMLTPNQIVCDLIYHDTQLLSMAEAKGCKTVNGLGMLLWQGALSFELWTGFSAPAEIMRSALLNALP